MFYYNPFTIHRHPRLDRLCQRHMKKFRGSNRRAEHRRRMVVEATDIGGLHGLLDLHTWYSWFMLVSVRRFIYSILWLGSMLSFWWGSKCIVAWMGGHKPHCPQAKLASKTMALFASKYSELQLFSAANMNIHLYIYTYTCILTNIV